MTRAALQAKTIDADTALARGWVDAVVPKDELLGQATATARELGQYSPAAYAATKRNCTSRCGPRSTRAPDG